MSETPSLPWYRRIGPGLITACVVIGPGSILTSSKVGAGNGYGMSWVVLLAVLFMMVFVTLGAKIGVMTQQSAGDVIRKRAGNWLAILIGVSIFFVAGSFQFGNNLGARSAMLPFVGNDTWIASGFIVGLNVLSLLFLFAFKNVYKALERLMTVFVALMLIAFALNLIAAKPDVPKLLGGLVGIGSKPKSFFGIEVVGLFGTTFVIAAAYYQSYLAQQKGWSREQLSSTLLDSRVGALLMMTITLMILSTAATVIHPKNLSPDQLKNLKWGEVADQLNPLFGGWGRGIFCIGLFCAAYSSFLVNSMVGGFVLSDGLGLGSKPTSLTPKFFTSAVLLIGMVVALISVQMNTPPVPAIVLGQAVTVLASPLLALILIWLSNRKDVVGDERPPMWMNVVAVIGFGLLLVIAYNTAGKVERTFTNDILPMLRGR